MITGIRKFQIVSPIRRMTFRGSIGDLASGRHDELRSERESEVLFDIGTTITFIPTTLKPPFRKFTVEGHPDIPLFDERELESFRHECAIEIAA